ncbi:hypothetical protein CVO96_06550 [Deinococcus koreensis]|uniref:Uncharacterized protein n=2 Tax=Deinococcus koreensis TaxID=2054903 RepID=A0A2K3UX24_9DEIO|nr:hypothetical protein CVO96_06550 [Deinococcus koreensis]
MGPLALRNLRVELTALRRQGVELSPNRSPFLKLEARTELDDLAAAPNAAARSALAATLGRPLLTFNDHGNAALSTWARRQRQRLTQAAQAPYRPAGPVAPAAQPERGAASGPAVPPPGSGQAIRSRAADGLVDWLAARLLPDVQAYVRTPSVRPQLLLYVGRPGSGRRETLERLLPQLGLKRVEVTAAPGLNELLAALEVNLAATLGEAPPLPESTELARVGPLLMRAGPLAIVLRDAERLSRESVRLIDFLMGLSHPLLVIALTTPAGQAGLEGLLGHHDQPGWLQVIHAPALTPESLDAASLVALPAAQAQHADIRFEAIRQTEGFLAAIRSELPTLSSARGRLSPNLKRTLRAEVAVALGDEVAALQTLALLPGPFTEATAQGTLHQAGNQPEGPSGLEHRPARGLIRRALQACILERVDSVLAVRMPEIQLRLPDSAPLLCFRSELQRAALAGSLDADVRQSLKRRLCVVPVTAQSAGPEVSLTPLTAALGVGGASQTHHLPGGYAVLAREDGWTVMRLGAAGHTVPRLELNFTPPAHASRWQLQLRLQRLDRGPEDSGIHVLHSPSAGQRPQVLSARPWSQPLEEGAWVQAAGDLSGRHLCLSVQASDVILHLGHPQFS